MTEDEQSRLLTVQGIAIRFDNLVGTRASVTATRVKSSRNQIKQQRDAVPPAVFNAEHLEVTFRRLCIRESIGCGWQETSWLLLARLPVYCVTDHHE